MHNERFILGGYLSNKFVGFAVADYSGLVTIHKQLFPELLTKGKASVKQLLLLQKERIRVIATAYPFQVKMPNRYIESWQSTDLSKLDWQVYPALFMPTENVGVVHQIADMLRGFGGSTGNKVDYSRFTDATPPSELVVLEQEFKFSDICYNAGSFSRTQAHTSTYISGVVAPNDMKHREIDTLILRVSSALPDHSPTEIWTVLKTDLRRANRIYDVNEVLEEVGEYELIWTDAKGSAKSLQKKSFFNLVKKLHSECNIKNETFEK